MRKEATSSLNGISPVILCGGSGTRLWPLSRDLYPKPFVALSNGESLFRSTLGRIEGLQGCAEPIVVTNEAHRFYVLEFMEEAGREGHIILEPVPKNTAPAICLAALAVKEQAGPDALMLVLPSDHYFDHADDFCATVGKAVAAAQAGKIVTFGIVPSRPDSAYGYIKANADYDAVCKVVSQFVEKPSVERAATMLQGGDHYWNSGIFLLRAATFLVELEKYRPEILTACAAAWHARSDEDKFLRPDPEKFLQSPEDSIDYAIMEKTDRALMAPLRCGWSDMGSWESFYQQGSQDDKGNVCVGDVLLEDVENSYIYSRGRLVAAVGMKNVAVIDSGDAVLVLPRDRCQDVKKIVSQLKKANREETKVHPVVYRPWGSFERLALGSRFQVKRIVVKPGRSLSLQLHHHRSEHWIIVSGTAEITVGEDTRLHTENESVYIPLGSLHKLRNPGKIPLELIEVQSGAYLGEDDIRRFEDSYGRK